MNEKELKNNKKEENSNIEGLETEISYIKNIKLSTKEVKLIGSLPYLIYDLSKFQDHLRFIYQSFEYYKVEVLNKLEYLLSLFCTDARYVLYNTFTYEDPEWNHLNDIDNLFKQLEIFYKIDAITDTLEDVCDINEDLLKIFGINSEKLYCNNQELQFALVSAICEYEKRIEELEKTKGELIKESEENTDGKM